jgi:hypothetical protein
VDQIVAKLRKADVELGKGKKVPEICKLPEVVTQSHRTDLLSLAAEIGWHEAGDGRAAEGSGERERAAQEDGTEQALDREILKEATKGNW